mgnify:CR=1 FL=1
MTERRRSIRVRNSFFINKDEKRRSIRLKIGMIGLGSRQEAAAEEYAAGNGY